MEQVFEILAAINSPQLQASFWWIKIPFLLVSAIFITVIIIGLTKTPYVSLSSAGEAAEFARYRPLGIPKVAQQWKRILSRLDRGTEAEYKLAVMEADALLDEMLKKMRFAGETMEERIAKITPYMLPNLEELREAHQVRNNIVYDPDYRLSLTETRRILEIYQRTFENLDLFR